MLDARNWASSAVSPAANGPTSHSIRVKSLTMKLSPALLRTPRRASAFAQHIGGFSTA